MRWRGARVGPGKEEFKQGEKVGHAVLDRGAGEQDPAVRGEEDMAWAFWVLRF